MLRMPENGPSSTSLLQQHKVEELSMSGGYNGSSSSSKRPRTSEDFLRFCDVVLSYANYPGDFRPSYLQHSNQHQHNQHQPMEEQNRISRTSDTDRRPPTRKLESPLNSVGESARGSTRSSTSSTHSDSSLDVDIETPEYDESWSMVTCWCGKPFAGRPMIECESCLVWLHLSCARVRKSNIPKHFKCARCKPCKGRRKEPPSPELESTPSSNSMATTPLVPLRGLKRKEDDSSPAHSNPNSPS